MSESPNAQLPLNVLPEARFSCQACGSCCRSGLRLGPLTASFRERLHRSGAYDAQGSPEALPFVLVPHSDGDRHYLRTLGERCIFLVPEGLCELHRRFGFAFKDRVCRHFPFVFHREPGGLGVSLRLDCLGIDRALTTGAPIGENIDLPLFAAEMAPEIPPLPPRIALEPGRSLSWEEYGSLESRLIAVLTECEDIPGAARALATELCARDTRTGPTEPDMLAAALEDTAVASENAFYQEKRTLPPGHPALGRALALTRSLGSWTRAVASRTLTPVSPPGRDDAHALSALRWPQPGGSVDRLLIEFLRNRIFSKEPALSRSFVSGVGSVLFEVALTAWSARLEAMDRGANEVESRDVVNALIIVERRRDAAFLRTKLDRHDDVLRTLATAPSLLEFLVF